MMASEEEKRQHELDYMFDWGRDRGIKEGYNQAFEDIIQFTKKEMKEWKENHNCFCGGEMCMLCSHLNAFDEVNKKIKELKSEVENGNV